MCSYTGQTKKHSFCIYTSCTWYALQCHSRTVFGEVCKISSKFLQKMSTAVDQVAAYTPVTQQAWVRSPVGTSFLCEVFWGFSSPVRQMLGSFRPTRSPNITWPSLSSLIIHYGHQCPEMLTRPKTSNIHTYICAKLYQLTKNLILSKNIAINN